ncbi:MAG: hypothetical protein WBC60_14620 [Cognaticolwellia sp.]
MKLGAIPIYKLIRMLTRVQTSIGGDLFLPHFGTIVLNRKAVYGETLTLFYGVTVGAKGAASKVIGLPIIGDNVKLSASATICFLVTLVAY